MNWQDINRQHQENFHPPGVTLLADVAAARWVERGTNHSSRGVDALIPAGFSAHARIFHPAESNDGLPVRWASVAEWAGRTAHPLMGFARVSVPAAGFGAGPAPWLHSPPDELGDNDVMELAQFLAGYTSNAEQCFFGIWEGYGQFGAGGTVILSADGGIPLSPPPEVLSAQQVQELIDADNVLSPPPEVLSAQQFICDDWKYLLYQGPLDALHNFLTHRFWGDVPNIWWPADRAWFVMSHYDLDSTYIAGSEECIQALLNHPSFEVMAIAGDAPFGWGQDQVNLP